MAHSACSAKAVSLDYVAGILIPEFVTVGLWSSV